MSVMSQEEMKTLVQGGTIVDDSSMDVQQAHMSTIAIAALGESKAALREAIEPYAEELEELVNGADFFAAIHRVNALDHIEWLRSLYK